MTITDRFGVYHRDETDKWAVYVTEHPLGFYYIGKGITANIISGKYKGSGIKLRACWELGQYPKDQWTSSIVGTFSCEDAAYLLEKSLITIGVLSDPWSLNTTTGGRGSRFGRLTDKVLQREKNKRKKSGKTTKVVKKAKSTK